VSVRLRTQHVGEGNAERPACYSPPPRFNDRAPRFGEAGLYQESFEGRK
jgi:hypothetical protein